MFDILNQIRVNLGSSSPSLPIVAGEELMTGSRNSLDSHDYIHRTLVFGLDLKCLVLWQLLLLTCAAPTHAQKYLGKNTFIYLFVSPIDAGSQKCTQGTPSVKGRKKYYLKLVNWYLRSGSKYYANICEALRVNFNLMKITASMLAISGYQWFQMF